MSSILTYLQVFVVGALICTFGQVLINFTKLTTARILVIFLLIGVFLEAIGVFDIIKEFGKAGATIPIVGFGSTLAKGAIEGVKERGLIGAIVGGVEASGAGLGGAIVIGFVVSLFSKSKTK
ncbi:MAG: SpoVA/SpoVAEb family sporulation membrane protein [Clostridia bacterium]